jgi:hypothetical protein
VEPVRIDDRMPGRLADLGVLEPDAAELRGDPLGRAADVAGVLRQRRDARDPQELEV